MNYINVLIALIQAALGNVFSREIKEGFVEVVHGEIGLTNNGSAPIFNLGGAQGILDTNDVYVILGYTLNHKKTADDPLIAFKDIAASGVDAAQQKSLRKLYEDGKHRLEIVSKSAIPLRQNRIFQFPPTLLEGFPAGFVPASKLIAFSGNSASTFNLVAKGDTSAIGTGIACLELLVYRIPNVGSATFTESYQVIEIA